MKVLKGMYLFHFFPFIQHPPAKFQIKLYLSYCDIILINKFLFILKTPYNVVCQKRAE